MKDSPGPGPRRLVRLIPGLADSGLSSLGTFVAGVYAVRTLSPEALGAYAIGFQAWVLGGILPQYLLLTPVQVRVVEHPPAERLAYLPRSLFLGLLPALVAGALFPSWTLIAPPEVPATVLFELGLTGAAATLLSPLQDHSRSLLHSGERSWSAAIVAGAYCVSVVACVVGLEAADVGPGWVPFGSVAAANLVSILVALGLARLRRPPPGTATRPLKMRGLAREGRGILLAALLLAAGGFASIAIVSHLLGAAMAGYAEAARVASRPIQVLGLGFFAVLSPKLMEASRKKDRAAARRHGRLFVAAVWLALLGYGALFGFAWDGNLVQRLLPAAYVVPGLVALTLFAQTISSWSMVSYAEMLGGSRGRTLAITDGLRSLLQVAVAVGSLVVGIYAIPLGRAVAAGVRILGFRWSLRSHYGAPAAGSRDGCSPGERENTSLARSSAQGKR